ncbi:MAG: sigma-70 family RNA polymerase sigma factor [Opitutales bacterium]|nr:sigma-70 family RNA polymerase sigma factor [Opitutales bacterium]
MKTREQLFEEVLDRHFGIVVKTARSFAGRVEDEQDLIQEILLRVWCGLRSSEARVLVLLIGVSILAAVGWGVYALNQWTVRSCLLPKGSEWEALLRSMD